MKKKKKEGNKNEGRGKKHKFMGPDVPVSLRVRETYPNNIVSLRGVTYCTAPSSDF
jgi:hypothetical protein